MPVNKFWCVVVLLTCFSNAAFAAAPSIPTSITVPVTATENVNYTVSWGASSGTVTRYELMGELVNLGSGDSSFRSKVRNKPAGQYCYMVRACNGSQCSAFIAKKCVNVLARTATPTITPGTGGFTSSTQVSISGASGATIRYTLNNTAVTKNSAVYSAPFNVSSNTTVRAKAFKVGAADSSEAKAVLSFFAAPKVNRFEWQPKAAIVGQATSFYWNVSNVSSCTSESSGTGSAVNHPANGVSGPHVYSAPKEHTTKWYCTDLAGNRFPRSSSEYLSAQQSIKPAPEVNRFEWAPDRVSVGEATHFYWNISNVTSCISESSGTGSPVTHPQSGVSGPHIYSSATDHTSKWYCIDLAGNRFPAGNDYLMARLVVEGPPAPKVNRFEWVPSTVNVGDVTNFHWNVSNVSSCTSESSGTGSPVAWPAHGTSGPHIYSAPTQHTSKWYCTDLQGNRFPANKNAFIQAILVVEGARAITYLHTDVLGSVIAESDSSGNIIKNTDYKPFGESTDK